MKKSDIKRTNKTLKRQLKIFRPIKIKVQKKFSILTAIFFSMLTIAGIVGIIYFLIISDDLSTKVKGECIGLIGLMLFIIPLFFQNTDSIEFLSEIILSPQKLTLVYQLKKTKREEVIPINTIESFTANLTANTVKQDKFAYLDSRTNITITQKSGDIIKFSVNQSKGFSFCTYDFLLKLISISQFLPNFQYSVKSNSEFVKKDIENFERFGKRLSFLQRTKLEMKKTPIFQKLILVVCFLLFFSSFSYFIYLVIPPFCTEEEKEFVSYIDEGYRAYQYDNYEMAIEKYEKALTIYQDDSSLYYYMAIAYEDKKEYENAIKTAKKGLEFLDQKSKFNKVHNFKVDSNNDIKLYTTLGDCNRKIGNFKEAKQNYTYVVDNVKYQYSNAKFYRGICEYYLGEKNEALKDFMDYKTILEKFFNDEEEREFKLKTYSQKDLNNVYQWIRATTEL